MKHSMNAFLGQSDPEYDRAWIQLARRGEDIEVQHNGETWQYVGSTIEERTGRWIHCFRHRCHPQSGARVYVSVLASVTWASAQEVAA